MYGILVLLMLNIIILVHELGHLLMAKMLKMQPKEFALGFGKTLSKFKGKDGITYKVNILPLGGYVNLDMERFKKEKAWKRFLVLSGGVFANLIFALLGCLVFVLMIKTPLFRTTTEESLNFLTIILYTFESLGDSISLVWLGFKDFLTSPNMDDFMGPIQLVREGSFMMKENFILGLPLLIIININVMIFNALPFPALDGGRLLFVITEMITRKKSIYEEKIHLGGFALIFIFSIFILGKDIITILFS